MKIAVVMTGGLHPSGREQIIPRYLNLFSTMARHHEVHAFILRHLRSATTYDLDGIVVHDLGSPSARLGLGRWAQWRSLERAMKLAGPFDVVHGVWADPAGLAAGLAGRTFVIPSVVECTSGEFVAHHDIGYGLAANAARSRDCQGGICARHPRARRIALRGGASRRPWHRDNLDSNRREAAARQP